MKHILAISRREFRQFYRDKPTLLIVTLLPVVLMSVYGLALTANIRNLALAVEDLDQTPASRRYIDAFAGTQKFIFVPTTAPPERLIDEGIARAALRIPTGFERDLKSGHIPDVQLLIDGSESNSAILMRGVSALVARSFQREASAGQIANALPVLRVRHWYNPGLKDQLFFGSGALGLVLILFPALLGALSSSREKELGTVTQAYASPLSATEWIVGKALPFIALGMGQFLVCFTFGAAAFGYPLPDHPLAFVAGTTLYLTAGVLFGMMVGNLTAIQSAAIQAINFGVFILSLMFSGFFMPIRNIPPQLRWISNLVPARHFIEITRDMLLRGGDWKTSSGPLVWLAALALLFFLANLGNMKRMQFKA